MSVTSVCKLCLQHRPLCDSHALPHSIFNYILRKNNGKAIEITDDESTPIQYSSDTWDAKLLCLECENLLNLNYDAYGIAVFRGHQCQTYRDTSGVTLLKVDQRRLRMFLISLLWRISISTHPNYSNIDIPFLWEDEMRQALKQKAYLPERKFVVSLQKLHDPTLQNGFSNENIRALVFSPFGRGYEGFKSVSFLFLGFFVEIFFPELPKKYLKRPSVLHGKNPVFFAPFLDVFNVPEIMSSMIQGFRKHNEGISKLK